ncbi:uncharacterized protein J3R85_006700 [Psidium guajava]|nr:uncharacterized protein J3R85_006700 [Psidium guajava]
MKGPIGMSRFMPKSWDPQGLGGGCHRDGRDGPGTDAADGGAHVETLRGGAVGSGMLTIGAGLDTT